MLIDLASERLNFLRNGDHKQRSVGYSEVL